MEYYRYTKIILLPSHLIENKDELENIFTKVKEALGFSSTAKLDENTTADQIGTNWLYYSALQLSNVLKLNSLLEKPNIAIFLPIDEYCIKKEIFEKERSTN